MLRIKVVCFALMTLWCSAGFASQEMMPVDEIRTGMEGVGRTVFAGTSIEEFKFEVLDVIRNFKPRRDLILVRLVGEHVEHTGVVAGMSGSPMYIDGKLIGALSYRLGLFQKEPIAGVTPIAQMLEVVDREQSRAQELAAKRGLNDELVKMAVGARDFDLEVLLPPYFRNAADMTGTASFTPLEIPLYFSGFEPGAMNAAAQLFGRAGVTVQQGGGSAAGEGPNNSSGLPPGSAYSVVIVDGDLGIQATGTVTYRDGTRVLGMGHPFLNSGAVGLPMGEAKILTTLSSMMASTKMATLTNIVGTIHQDRTTGIMGVSGEVPDMIPVRLRFNSEFYALRDFNFRVAADRSLHSLTPLIFSIVLNSALESARMSVSNQTLVLDGKINLKDRESISVRNYYAGGRPSDFLTDGMEVIGEIAGIVGALLANDFETPEIESVQLDFHVLPQKKLALVQKLTVDKAVVRPGEQVTVSVLLREFQGEPTRVKQTLTIPENLTSNRISIYAGSGSSLTRQEARTAPQRFRPKSFEQLLGLLNRRRKNNFVFFQMRTLDKGVLRQGQELPNLPPSVLSVLKAQRSSGDVTSLRDRALSEQKVQVDYSVRGGKSIWLKVEKK